TTTPSKNPTTTKSAIVRPACIPGASSTAGERLHDGRLRRKGSGVHPGRATRDGYSWVVGNVSEAAGLVTRSSYCWDEFSGDPGEHDHRDDHDEPDEPVIIGDPGGEEARSQQDHEPHEVADDRRQPTREARHRQPRREHPGGVDVDAEAHGRDARERGPHAGS